MDDINATPKIEKIGGKDKNNYHGCHIYSGRIDELENNVHLYISGNNDRGHLSTTIDHVKLIHKIFGEFIEKYDKEQERIDRERVVIENCLDCDAHAIINDPDPNDSFCEDDVAIICKLALNQNINPHSEYMADWCGFKSISKSCRPHRTREESQVPNWCPKDYYKYIKREQVGE